MIKYVNKQVNVFLCCIHLVNFHTHWKLNYKQQHRKHDTRHSLELLVCPYKCSDYEFVFYVQITDLFFTSRILQVYY